LFIFLNVFSNTLVGLSNISSQLSISIEVANPILTFSLQCNPMQARQGPEEASTCTRPFHTLR